MEKGRKLVEFLEDKGYENSVLLEPEQYDEAVVGVTWEGRVVYSYEKIVDMLMRVDGMPYEDAIEYTDYNTVRGVDYMGPYAPILIYGIEDVI